LSSANEQTRLEAVRELSQHGGKLSQKQVNRLVGLMRNGQASWSNYLYRESHCTLIIFSPSDFLSVAMKFFMIFICHHVPENVIMLLDSRALKLIFLPAK
jgi:hypothetical protein